MKAAAAQRIALFGGSFDPPHNAHLAIARAAVEQARLDRVIFIPCSISPLKNRQPGASPAQRVSMLHALVEGFEKGEVSEWELQRPGPSYSWETAEHFASAISPGSQLFWLMGADQWEQIHRWARADYLASLVEFLVFGRDDNTPGPRPGFRATFLHGLFPGSSTEVRRRCAAGEPLSSLLPPGVERIIRAEGLYRA